MVLCKIMGSNYPYRKNVPVYDAATLVAGEMIMRHASWHSGTNKFYITAYTNANTEAEDSLGCLEASSEFCYTHPENSELYKIGSDYYPDAAISAGGNFMPTIVNPGATYFCFYDQTDAQSCTHAETAETTWQITSLENNIDGGWLFTTTQADSAATYGGLLRYLTASASGSATVAAVTVDTSSDYCKVHPIGHRVTTLNAEATGFTTEAAAGDGIFLDVIENYIQHSSLPEEEMRYWDHDNLTGLVRLKVRAEIVQLRHAYRAVVA